LSVDRETNRLIPINKLCKVPLIKELVDAFVEIFSYLTIDMVWLIIHKKEPGAGFKKLTQGLQTWYKDHKYNCGEPGMCEQECSMQLSEITHRPY
jgi:hypothetical protein